MKVQSYHFSQFLSFLAHERAIINNDVLINELVFDTRHKFEAEHAVFIAIKTKYSNGHSFIQDAYKKGIRNFILLENESIEMKDVPFSNMIYVSDTLKALQEIGYFHKKNHELTTIGITGSNGKTIVKEWLFEILNSNFNVVKSPKSYNSQIGVPLSIWQISNDHTLGIFEAGISKSGEMKALEKIIQPDLGIFTNLGSAHDEGFSSRINKLDEKLKLFEHAKKVILRDNLAQEIIKVSDFESKKLIAWGKDKASKYQVNWIRSANKTTIEVNDLQFEVPFIDEASLENISHCIVVALELNQDLSTIIEGINRIRPLSMRLELVEGINGIRIINDAYNHDPGGLKVALNLINNQYKSQKKSYILSEFKQSVTNSTNQLSLISEMIGDDYKNVLLLGEHFKSENSLPPGYSLFRDTEDLIQNLSQFDFKDQALLIKGARVYGFEKIVAALQSKVHGTRLEINLSKLSHNLNFFRSKLKKQTRLMIMVKAFAYGAGSREIAHFLQSGNVDYLGVAYPDEGVTLRKMGLRTPIFVMNPSINSYPLMAEYELEPEVYSLSTLKEIIRFSESNSSLRIHLNVDTGMNRLGFDSGDLEELKKLLELSKLEIASIFSHLAAADDTKESEFTQAQVEQFNTTYDFLTSDMSVKPMKHILNSAGILNFPEYQFDMVRLGIGLYGINNAEDKGRNLESISRLITEISQIKKITEKDSVGYGRKGKMNSSGKIATIPIGYADGFSRSFSNGKGKVYVKGQLAPVIGNVCMDMTMIDISNIDAIEGDEVEVFGPNNPVENLAEWASTIPYEILTNVSERVNRIYFAD